MLPQDNTNVVDEGMGKVEFGRFSESASVLDGLKFMEDT